MPLNTCVICQVQFAAMALKKYCSKPCRYKARTLRPRHRTYQSWKWMISRCTRPKTVKYEFYGGRGIKVCDRWMDFDCFMLDMGERPSLEFSLDRIDSDGHYEPGNCRWASKEMQVSNMRSNRMLTCDGETLNASQWARRLGVRVTVIYGRLSYGWSVKDAVTIPPIPKSAKRPVPKGTGRALRSN